MSETPETPETPERPPPAETPEPQTSRIGVDSWVAESEARRSRAPTALLSRGAARTPDSLKLLVFVGFAASVPFGQTRATFLPSEPSRSSMRRSRWG
jgi:hypothetical protein